MPATAYIALAALALAAPAASQVRVLVITGQSDTRYHDWRVSTPFLTNFLKHTGRFDVRVTEEPRGLTREALSSYDVLLLNYNGPRWGTVAESAVEDFVKSGKGLVSLHGVTYGPLIGVVQKQGGGWEKTSGWAAYPDLVGVTWEPGSIGHAWRHAFKVKLSSNAHPITRGMDADFTVNDELYHRMTHKPGITVLASAYDDPARKGTGKDEPIAWTAPFGKGRIFHTTLGHDISALYEPSVMAMLARSVEWAGTGEVTLPAHIEFAHPKDGLRVLVVTGGHGYDPSFYTVFRNDAGYRWSHATSQKEAFRPGMKDKWDVVVLYDMHNVIAEAEQKHLREYVEAGKGIVSMHHAIVDYTSWPWWYQEVIGGKYFEKAEGSHAASKYKEDVPLILRPAKGQEQHPVVRGLGELVTIDECYKGMWHSAKITVLMETDAACNDRPVVYLGPNPQYRAVYVQLGHGTHTHLHPGYRKLVENAILWAGRKTDQ
jgi:type 1 glutamine amidotransferase